MGDGGACFQFCHPTGRLCVVRPSINTCYASSVILAIDSRHVAQWVQIAEKVMKVRGQRFNLIVRPSALLRLRLTWFPWCDVEAHLFLLSFYETVDYFYYSVTVDYLIVYKVLLTASHICFHQKSTTLAYVLKVTVIHSLYVQIN